MVLVTGGREARKDGMDIGGGELWEVREKRRARLEVLVEVGEVGEVEVLGKEWVKREVRMLL